MKPNHSISSIYRNFHAILVESIRHAFPRLSRQDAEDLIQDLFVILQRRGTTILGEICLETLKRHAYRLAISLIRARKALKRGGGKVTSLEQVLESFGPVQESDNAEPIQEIVVHLVDQLVIADRVIEETRGQLSDREQILLRHIRNWAPDELSLDQLYDEFSPSERLIFSPVKCDLPLQCSKMVIKIQISRSKSSLQEKLRNTRASMGL